MANYGILKSAIEAVIKTNGNNEITGALLQQSLLSMISSLGAHYGFVDVATPSTNPGTPDQNVMYFAATAGTYSNFGGIVVGDGEACFLCYNGTWVKKVSGAATVEQIIALGEQISALSLGKFYGFFTTTSELPVGDIPGYAYVGASAPFAIYVFVNGTWSDSGAVYGPAEGNGEDIDTNAQGKLQFANRPNTDGMGYVILRKDKTFAEQITNNNTIYEIRYVFDLNAASVIIPAGCILKFDGGKLDNGTIILQDTTICGGPLIFGNSLLLSGTAKGKVFAAWYADQTDWTTIFNGLFNLGCVIELEPWKTYNVGSIYNGNIVVEDKNFKLIGNGATLKIKKYSDAESYGGSLIVSTGKTESLAVSSVQEITNPSCTEIVVPGSDFKIGDILKIYSEDVVPFSQQNNQYCGEYISPMEIIESGENQIIRVQRELYYDYLTNIKIARLTPTSTLIQDLNVISENNVQAIQLSRLDSPVMRNVHFVYSNIWPVISVAGCVNPLFDGIVVNRVNDGLGWPGTGVGYGVNAEANQNLKLVNSTFFSLRHAYTTGGNNRDILSSDDWMYFGCERGAVISNCSAFNCQLAFDTHPVGVDITFDNCYAFGGVLAEIRTPKTILQNSKASKAGLAYIAGLIPIDVIIKNCVQTGIVTDPVIALGSAPECKLECVDIIAENGALVRLGNSGGSIIQIKNCETDDGVLANLLETSEQNDCELYVKNCKTGFSSSAAIVGAWKKIDVDGLKINQTLKTATSAVACVVRNLGNNSPRISIKNIDFYNSTSDYCFGPTQVIHQDSISLMGQFIHGKITQHSASSANLATSDNAIISYASRAQIADFLKLRMTDGRIIMPRYPSEESDYSDVAFQNASADGVVVTFVNCNNYQHVMPTLGGVSKTIPAFGSASMMYSAAGGWRWI